MKPKLTIIIPVYNQESLVIRALESIPNRKDIEIIVIDDGSTDDTWQNLLSYRDNHLEQNIILLYNKQNEGVSIALNKGYDIATGEYIVLLGSDDYFYTEEFNNILEELDGTDLIYFNLRTNNRTILELREDTKKDLCGSTKFMRREFIGETRCPPDKKAGEDLIFYNELLLKKPTEKFTNKTIKHYNFPRRDSLYDLLKRGEI